MRTDPRPHAESELPEGVRSLLGTLTSKFYDNLTTHVGASKDGRMLGAPSARDPDTHAGIACWREGQPLAMNVGASPAAAAFLRSVAEGTVEADDGASPKPEVRARYADALARFGAPRTSGVLRVLFISNAWAFVVDLPRPSPFDDEGAGPRAVDLGGGGSA